MWENGKGKTWMKEAAKEKQKLAEKVSVEQKLLLQVEKEIPVSGPHVFGLHRWFVIRVGGVPNLGMKAPTLSPWAAPIQLFGVVINLFEKCT